MFIFHVCAVMYTFYIRILCWQKKLPSHLSPVTLAAVLLMCGPSTHTIAECTTDKEIDAVETALARLPLNVHCCQIRWKASQQAGAEGGLSNLTLKDKHGQVIEKQLPGGKVKKKAKNEIILETNTRSRKKCVTTILGVHLKMCQQPEAVLQSHMHFLACPAVADCCIKAGEQGTAHVRCCTACMTHLHELTSKL